MQLTINGKKCDLNFGVKFVRTLDQHNGLSAKLQGQQVSLGYGVLKVLPALQAYNPAALSAVLYAASWDNKPRPSQDDCDSYLETLSEKQLEDLFEKINKAINDSTVLKLTVKNMTA